jgi:hypothetical protein
MSELSTRPAREVVQMAGIDAPQTRRAALAAMAGAVAATAMAAFEAPATALAHDPDDVRLGGSNSTTTETSIQNGSNNNTVLSVYSQSASQAFAVTNNVGTAVFGNSNGAYGVVGNGPTGVLGQGTSGAAIGTDGKSFVVGGTGARGWATATSGATVGVAGRVDSAAGFGVLARNTAGGTALEADGKVRFRRSGKAIIAKNAASKKVIVSGVASSSMVYAVLATSRAGRWVRAVVPASGYFTIYLNTKVSSATKVSWFVLDPFI